jgi:hypothetical protein
VNGADVGSGASGHRSVGGIADDDGVDLVWIVIVFLDYTSGVTQGKEDQRERTDGGNDREQDGSGVERLAASEIEAGSDGWVVVLRLSRGEPGWRRSGGVGHTDSVDALPKGGGELMTGSATEVLVRPVYKQSQGRLPKS